MNNYSNDDIFKEENKAKTNTVKWETIGQMVAGTLVNKKTVPGINGDVEMYDILQKDGTIIGVFGKKDIADQMRDVSLGQIIGMKFVKEIPNKRKGLNAWKVIEVYKNKSIVNEEWLQEQTSNSVLGDLEEVSFADNDPFPTNNANREVKKEDDKSLITQINELAAQKLGVTDEAQVMKAVMDKTGRAFIESNYSEIIIDLAMLPDMTN